MVQFLERLRSSIVVVAVGLAIGLYAADVIRQQIFVDKFGRGFVSECSACGHKGNEKVVKNDYFCGRCGQYLFSTTP